MSPRWMTRMPPWRLTLAWVGCLTLAVSLLATYVAPQLSPSIRVEPLLYLGTGLAAVALSPLLASWFYQRPAILFLCWCPAFLIIFLNLRTFALIGLRKDFPWALGLLLAFGDQFLVAARLVALIGLEGSLLAARVAVALEEFMLILLLLLCGRVSLTLLKGKEFDPRRSLAVTLQAYAALVLAMSTVVVVLESSSLGKAFSGMLPDLLAGAAASPQRLIANLEGQEYLSRAFAFELDALYFSVITAATVGYGDIHPVLGLAKIAVVCQVIASQFVLIVLLGIVITGFGRGSNRLTAR